jgi:hypothetical protein
MNTFFNRQLIVLVAAISVCSGAYTSAAAAPLPDSNVTALLSSPVEVPVKDPALKKAIEALKEKPSKPDEHKNQKKPDGPIGKRMQNRDRVLILGGPEIFPM